MSYQAPATIEPPRVLAPVSVLPDPEYFAIAGRYAMDLGCRPARKFKTIAGDRTAFHPPRSRAELKLVENPK